MTNRRLILTVILLCAAVLAACSTPDQTPPVVDPTAPDTATPPHWTPSLITSWQIQMSGHLDTSPVVEMFVLDLFDVTPETIADLHSRGTKVVCSFSAGTYDSTRPDAADFPTALLGQPLPDSPNERWLNVSDLQSLAPIMLHRISIASQKGCDGLDPRHMDVYARDSGFPLNAEDQLAYNMFLANAAHQNGLSIGLHNNLQQVAELFPYFDWELNEECFSNNDCDLLLPFIQAGKPVFLIEYHQPPNIFCPPTNALNINGLHKNTGLDAYRTSCR